MLLFLSQVAILSSTLSKPSGSIMKCHFGCKDRYWNEDGLDFLHILYHDQVPWAPDAHTIEFGCIPNWSKNTATFHKF